MIQQWLSTILMGCFILLLPIVGCYVPGFFSQEIIYTFTTIWIAVAVSVLLLFNKTNEWYINSLDIAIGVFVIYAMGNLFMNPDFMDKATSYKWMAIVLGYIWVRNLQQKEIVFYALILSGVEESIIGILQYANWVESQHSFFDITGHLGNPGPLGGYIAVCFILSTYMLKEVVLPKRDSLLITLVGISTFILLIGLILSDSRSAWMGTVIAFLAFMPHMRRKIVSTKKAKLYLVLLLFIVGIVLYFYRPLSAHARMLIWRVSTEMVADAPLVGHGWGSFQKQYMLYQAEHFKQNYLEEKTLLASNVSYTYNEGLHLAIEMGLIGLVLAIFIIVCAVRMKSTSPYKQMIMGAIIVWIIFATFSYPSNIFPLLMAFSLLSGCLESKKAWFVVKNNHAKVLFMVLLAIIGFQSFQKGIFYQQASQQFTGIFRGKSLIAKEFAQTHYDELKNNTTFNLTYIRSLLKKSSDLKDEYIGKSVLPNTETYNLLGDFYYRIGNYNQAEKTYLLASYMVPNQMKANYTLWRMYNEMGEKKKAIDMAHKILSQPVKVVNSFTINAKTEIKEYLLKENNSFGF